MGTTNSTASLSASVIASASATASSGAASSTSTDAYCAVVDDKTFYETYLSSFYDAVYNGIRGAMCAMNRINGTYACENDIIAWYLKAELGFPDIVHPDAGAQHNGIDSANAGEDFGSSNYWSNDTLGTAFTNGSFTVARRTIWQLGISWVIADILRMMGIPSLFQQRMKLRCE